MRYLLIDTNIYERARYNFRSSFLKVLSDACKRRGVKLLTHPVIDGEVNLHIASESNKLITMANKISKALHADFENAEKLFFINERELESKYEMLFDDYKKQFECVELTNTGVTNIIQGYFSQRPPFSNGNKKSEFPDAFVLHALKEFTNSFTSNTKDYVIVVSNDSDWEEFVKNCKFCSYYSSLLEMLRAEDLGYWSIFNDQIGLWCQNNRSEIESEIARCLEEMDYTAPDRVMSVYVSVSEVKIADEVDCLFYDDTNDELEVYVQAEASLHISMERVYRTHGWDGDDWETANVSTCVDTDSGVSILLQAVFDEKNKKLIIKDDAISTLRIGDTDFGINDLLDVIAQEDL